MKIGIVCYPTFGGSGVVATELGMGLAKRGHKVHFITYKQPARLNSFMENVYLHEVTEPDYPLFQNPPYDTALASKLVDVIRYEDLDLLHVHYAIPHAAVAYMAKKILQSYGKYIPVITTLHGTDITVVGKNKDFASVVEFSINQSDGVTAVSQSLKKDTNDNFNITKNIEVIFNPIDLDRFSPSDKDHFKKAIAPDGEKILTHTSNFRKVKRVEDVIYTFQKVYEKIPCKLIMIGDGPERSNLEELCRKIGLCNEIRFLGKQDAVEELLAISDVFLLPSDSESFGLAALEAMACKVPVVSSNAGGIPEVNEHGVTGYLSDPGNIEEMAANVIDLLSDPKKHRRFRQNAYNKAKEFEISKIVKQYEEFYQRVIESCMDPVVS